MSHSSFLLILVFLKAGGLCAQQPDSAGISTKAAIVSAGWLRQWEGVPTQWFGTTQGGVEVTGYANIDKKIRLFGDGTFETDIYKERFMPFLRVAPLNECCPCRERRDDEVTVLTGTWTVKRDSVFLSYRWENIYRSDPYELYQANREQGVHPNNRPRVMSGCVFCEQETCVWRDGRLCFGEGLGECYR